MRGEGHQLHQSARPRGADRGGIEAAFLPHDSQRDRRVQRTGRLKRHGPSGARQHAAVAPDPAGAENGGSRHAQLQGEFGGHRPDRRRLRQFVHAQQERASALRLSPGCEEFGGAHDLVARKASGRVLRPGRVFQTPDAFGEFSNVLAQGKRGELAVKRCRPGGGPAPACRRVATGHLLASPDPVMRAPLRDRGLGRIGECLEMASRQSRIVQTAQRDEAREKLRFRHRFGGHLPMAGDDRIGIRVIALFQQFPRDQMAFGPKLRQMVRFGALRGIPGFAPKFGRLDRTIAAAQVARMPADGYALYLASAGDFTLARSTFGARLPYNPEQDFTFITLLVKVPMVLVVHPSVPVTNLQEFITYAKSMPKQLNYASFGNGSTSHLSAEAFNLTSGIEMAHVAYKGSGPAVTDLLAGRVQVMFDTVLSGSRFTKTGQLKSLGVSTLKRVPLLSETPTLDESGLPGYEIATWLGIVAPAGLPASITQVLATQLDAFTKDPEIRKQLDALGLLVDGSGPKAFPTFIQQESARMDKLIKDAGIKFE